LLVRHACDRPQAPHAQAAAIEHLLGGVDHGLEVVAGAEAEFVSGTDGGELASEAPTADCNCE
jgi:hypothetical protein